MELGQIHQILKNVPAVIWDEAFLGRPNMAELTGDDHNEFLYLSASVIGHEYMSSFEEGNNRQVHYDGSAIFLKDVEGEEVKIRLLDFVNTESLI